MLLNLTESTPSVEFECVVCGYSLSIDEPILDLRRPDAARDGIAHFAFGYAHPSCDWGVELGGYEIVGRGTVRYLEAKRHA
jgi:hypothetical protein